MGWAKQLLTSQFKTYDDIPKDSMLQHLPRFTPENFEQNKKLAHQIEEMASKKGCKPTQLAISWTMNLSRRKGVPDIIPIPGATTIDRLEENSVFVEISDEEMSEIDATLAKFEVKGGRYMGGHPVNT